MFNFNRRDFPVRKKYLAVLGFAVAVLLAPLALMASAHATGFRSGDTVTVAKSETVDGTLFVAGQTVEIAGEVDGDVFCAGNTITITGTVHGDVICAGQTVNVRGIVDGDVRVAGATVTVEAKVAGNVSAAGQIVALHSAADVKDFHAAGDEIVLAGNVRRDVDIAGSTLAVNGQVGRNVTAAGEKVALGSSAKITGNFEYTSKSDVSKAKGATVVGQTHHTAVKNSSDKAGFKQFTSGMNWFFALAGFITSLILVAVMPRLFYSVSSRGIEQPGMSFLSGLGTNVGVVLLVILLAMTVIGLPLAGLVLLGWVLLLLLSLPVFSFYLGRVLLSKSTNNVLYYMLLGGFIILLLNFIPVVGPIVLFLGSWFGVGMLTLAICSRWSKPHYTIKQGKKA